MLITSIFSFFPQCFNTSQNKFQFCCHIYFVFCLYAFNLDQSEILSFGKDLCALKACSREFFSSSVFVEKVEVLLKKGRHLPLHCARALTLCNICATIQNINLKLGLYVHYQKGNLCDKSR